MSYIIFIKARLYKSQVKFSSILKFIDLNDLKNRDHFHQISSGAEFMIKKKSYYLQLTMSQEIYFFFL